MSSGGERTPYTHNEKLLLASLVDKHKNIIENKRTDASTVQAKHQEWEKIAAEYNAQASLINTKRTAAQLKKLWNNLKQRKRKATTELKYQRLVTGGGPEPSEEQDPVMEAVSIAAPHADVTLPCPWDSTGVYEAKHTKESSEVSTEYEIVVAETEDEPEDVLSPSTSDQGTISVIYTGINTPRTTASMVTPRTSTETNPIQSASTHLSSKTGRKGVTSFIRKESDLRVQKVQDSIEQQKELHNIRLQIENEQLQTAIATRKKAEAEAKLALLQLKLFEKQHQLE